MYDCFPDPERNDGSYLVTDPSVSCEPSTSRFIVHIHTGLLSLFVGLGFPKFIAFKIRQLKRAKKLTASSSFASLFQYYIPAKLHFESYHMIRKAMLILTVITPSATGHLAASFAVNLVFLLVVICTKPLICFPSTTFKSCNLYLLSELSGATVTHLGNLLALIGAISDNQDVINMLSATFAILNVFFAVTFFLLTTAIYGKQRRIESRCSTANPPSTGGEGHRRSAGCRLSRRV